MDDSRSPSADGALGYLNAHTEDPNNMADDVSIFPTPPPSQFLSYLFDRPEIPTRDLVQPYLSYELQLRKAFAREDPGIPDLAGVVSIYDGDESLFKIRAIDRQKADTKKYLMQLPTNVLPPDRDPAIVLSLSEYTRNLKAFTHDVLEDIDWSNVVVAGSAALLPLLPRRAVSIRDDTGVEDPLESYFQTIAPASDIDIFFYGLDSEDSAIKRILELEAAVRNKQRLHPSVALSMRSENAITFISPRWPYRHVQIILRLYKSISEILVGFDVDSSCVAFDGRQVYTTPRGTTAIVTRTNTIDLSRRSPSYENRLWKYRNQNFDAFWDRLDRSRIDVKELCGGDDHDFRALTELTGLARLIFSEDAFQNRRGGRGSYYQNRAMKRIDHGRETAITTAESGYISFEVPYGERFTAKKVREHINKHSKNQMLFGTIQKVAEQGCKSDEMKNEKLVGKVTFLKHDSGQQMIGSFHPLNEDDWTEIAYASTTGADK